MHPDRGARFLAPWSRGVAPTTRGSGIACDPATPLGCRTHCLTGKCDTLTGSYIFHGILFPGSSALRASTPGLKSDDPSGALPLRDRQAVAAGEGSVKGIAQRQGLSLHCFNAQMRHPERPIENRLLAWNYQGDAIGWYRSHSTHCE